MPEPAAVEPADKAPIEALFFDPYAGSTHLISYEPKKSALPQSCGGALHDRKTNARATLVRLENRKPALIKERVLKSGAPGRIRTSDHLIRSQVLYPAELRARIKLRCYIMQLAEREGFEPSIGL